jgi:hypothetical protein
MEKRQSRGTAKRDMRRARMDIEVSLGNLGYYRFGWEKQRNCCL